jgi:hypothetical protein
MDESTLDAPARSTTAGLSRRTMLKRAAAAGALAWTAPVIVDSLASPAAAQSCPVTIVSLGNAFTSAADNQSSYTTANFTSTAGSRILVLATTQQNPNNPAFSVTGGPVSGTSSAVTSVTITSLAGNDYTLWVAQATGSGTGGNLTVNVAANSGDDIVLRLFEVTCTDSIVAVGTNTGSFDGSPDVTFPAPNAQARRQVAVFGVQPAVTYSGWSDSLVEFADNAAGTTSLGAASLAPAANIGNVTVNISNGVSGYAAVALELRQTG